MYDVFSFLSHWQNAKAILIYEWLKKFHSEIYFEILPAWPIKWRLTRFSTVPVSWRSKIISDYRDVSPRSRFCHDCKRVCLTFVFLYLYISRVPWSSEEVEGKVEKRERRLLACQVSECTTCCGMTSPRWRIYRFRWRGRLNNAAYIFVWPRHDYDL